MPSFADNCDGFVLPNARFNPAAQPPSGSGLLTPPESPTSSKTPLPMPISTQRPVSTPHLDSPQSFRSGPSEPELQSAQHDLSRVSETIYTIIEQVIEQKLAEAMGPLRLNLRRFDSENTDLGCQVGHLEQQLHALQSISVTASNNLELMSSLANQLSTATNLMQKTHDFTPSSNFPILASPASRRQEHYNVQPQFCFEPRSSKKQRYSQTKSRKPRLVNYMLSKCRTGGTRD